MKKINILILGFLSLVTSCSVPKTTLIEKDDEIVVNITLPGEVDPPQTNLLDTNLYNTYFIVYKNDQTQVLQYEYRYDLYRMVDSTNVDRIDTLQNKVLWKDLN